MEVILRETVPSVGHAGDLVKVKAGYARNYLLPKGLAYPATAGNKKRVEAEAVQRAQRSAAEKGDAEVLAEKLATVSVEFTVKAGEGDKLFGSITSADIAERLGTLGYQIDKRIIELEEPIKMIGIYKVPIRLHTEVKAEVRVWVVKEES
ncbi:MAG: 50S ribosomal protein L9 [Gemmatimonadota bacterium]|nr:MAG: 50S ribosomal protein L9 [Gemmatimonadota bacterium]